MAEPTYGEIKARIAELEAVLGRPPSYPAPSNEDDRSARSYHCARCGQQHTPKEWFQHGDVVYCSNCAHVDPLSGRLWIRSEGPGFEAPPDPDEVAVIAEPRSDIETTKTLAFVGFFALFLLSLGLMLEGGQVGFVFGFMLACGLVVVLTRKKRVW